VQKNVTHYFLQSIRDIYEVETKHRRAFYGEFHDSPFTHPSVYSQYHRISHK